MTLPVKLHLECFLTVQPKPVVVHVVTDGDLERTLAEIEVDDYMDMARQIQKLTLTRDGTLKQIEQLLTQANLQQTSTEMGDAAREDADFEGAYDDILEKLVRPMAQILKGLTA